MLSALTATGVFEGFPPGELTPVDELAAWGRFLRSAPQATAGEIAIARRYIGALRQAFFSMAARQGYAKTFFEAFPGLKGKVWVHHAVEQQVMKKYPGLITKTEPNSPANLRGVPNSVNVETHLKKCRQLWDAFYEKHPTTCTKQELLDHAKIIDDIFGSQFSPPIR